MVGLPLESRISLAFSVRMNAMAPGVEEKNSCKDQLNESKWHSDLLQENFCDTTLMIQNEVNLSYQETESLEQKSTASALGSDRACK